MPSRSFAHTALSSFLTLLLASSLEGGVFYAHRTGRVKKVRFSGHITVAVAGMEPRQLGSRLPRKLPIRAMLGEDAHVFEVAGRPAAHVREGILEITGQPVDDLGAPSRHQPQRCSSIPSGNSTIVTSSMTSDTWPVFSAWTEATSPGHRRPAGRPNRALGESLSDTSDRTIDCP